MEAKQLLYCWVAQGFNVLVPKTRGQGFLKVPYGHHHDPALSEIGDSVGVEVTGLEGALHFWCPGSIYHGPQEGQQEFAARVMPELEKHYGWASREITASEFWKLNPYSRA